jgi:hypothetical protein
MTRCFYQRIRCKACGKEMENESDFSQEIRHRKEMDSSHTGVSDIDAESQRLIVHKYRDGGVRDVQTMLEIEVKTHGADLSFSQKDTLSMHNQVIRNRRNTPTKRSKRQTGNGPLKVWSECAKGMVWMRHFGIHILVFDGTCVANSETIKWDGRKITKDDLWNLLEFRIDPDTFKPIEARSHHKRQQMDLLNVVSVEAAHV